MPLKKEDLERYIHKLSSQTKIEQLAASLKDFTKKTLNIKYEYTYHELKDIIDKKRIDSEIKDKIKALCDMFENLEYMPKKPSKKEISQIKSTMRDIFKGIKDIQPQKDKKKSLFKISKNASKIIKKKQKEKRLEKKVEKEKKDITKKIIKKIRSDKKEKPIIKDHEYSEIARFVKTSIQLNMSLSKIKKELKDLGFPKEKTDKVIKDIKS